jgi:hypothetical protein
MAGDRFFFWPSALVFGDRMIRTMPNGTIRSLDLGIPFIRRSPGGFQ